MSAIKIQRDGSRVQVVADTNINWTFTFHHQCSDEPYAILLTKAIREKLEQEISSIKRQAYEKGWKDKSAKVRKATQFGGSADYLSIY